MEQKTDIRSIFINLPIQEIARTRAFWTRLGFRFNEAFSDEKALCLILKQDAIYAMLITHEYFQTFTNRPIADSSSTQVLLAIDVGSRERVEEVMRIAVENAIILNEFRALTGRNVLLARAIKVAPRADTIAFLIGFMDSLIILTPAVPTPTKAIPIE